MAEYFTGKIIMVGFNFAPIGWAFCNGQLLSIEQNDALYTLLGTTYGGDGQTTFALPDMRGRVPYHQGTGPGLSTYSLGQRGGSEEVTLTSAELPAHTHTANSNPADGGQVSPTNNFWGGASSNIYSTTPPAVAMNPLAVGLSGGNQPHENMPPFLCVNFIINLEGIYPAQN